MKNPKFLEDTNWEKVFHFVFLIYVIEKFILAVLTIKSGTSIYDLGFSFGGYIESLSTGNGFSYMHKGLEIYSSRMPLIPLITSFFGFISEDQLVVALIKNFFCSAIFYALIISLRKTIESDILKLFSYLLILLSISVIPVKHICQITYEEGYVIELLVIWFIIIYAFAGKAIKPEYTEKNVSILILLGSIIFLFKSSMILIFLLSWIPLIACIIQKKVRKTRLVFLAAAVIISCGSIFSWSMHNYSQSGKFSIMTSHDGSNLYRASNSLSMKLYPYHNLDYIMGGPSQIFVPHLGEVQIPDLPNIQDFENEWQWNNYYKDLSKKWIFENPTLAFKFFRMRTFNYFFSLKKTPHFDSNIHVQGHRTKQETIQHILTIFWLTLGRLFMIGLIYYLLIATKKKNYILVLTVLVALGAYSAPYLIGFNYERHITVFLVLVLSSSLFLKSKLKGH